MRTASLGECYAGIDDGYFVKGMRKTVMALAVHCFVGSSLCPFHIAVDTVEVDGLDAVDVAASLVRRASTEKRVQLSLVLLDTNIFAGFNVLDPEELQRRIEVPVAVVYWYRPEAGRVKEALRKHFPDWSRRLGILEKVWSRLTTVSCSKGKVLVAVYGSTLTDVWSKLCRLQLYTRHPEPLYTAHVVASAASRFLISSGVLR
ncbi:MAG: DUF99 family protein [Thermoproteota archaeon]